MKKMRKVLTLKCFDNQKLNKRVSLIFVLVNNDVVQVIFLNASSAIGFGLNITLRILALILLNMVGMCSLISKTY